MVLETLSPFDDFRHFKIHTTITLLRIAAPNWMALAMIRVGIVGTGSIPMQHGGENTGFIQ
jgi:hypothetical protein